MKKEVYKFLSNRIPKLGVLSTVGGNNKPESALLGYAVLENLTIIFTTSIKSRKWQNLLQNPYVALTIGQGFTESNVQYQGIATLITDGEKMKDVDKIFYSLRPDLLTFKSLDNGFIQITPAWIRFMDFTDGNHKTQEVTF